MFGDKDYKINEQANQLLKISEAVEICALNERGMETLSLRGIGNTPETAYQDFVSVYYRTDKEIS